jgi:hypothetical protein
MCVAVAMSFVLVVESMPPPEKSLVHVTDSPRQTVGRHPSKCQWPVWALVSAHVMRAMGPVWGLAPVLLSAMSLWLLPGPLALPCVWGD